MKRPEPNRPIKCKCFDWSPYTVEGMFILYRKGSGKRDGMARFCVKDEHGNWNAARGVWLDVESWQYVDTPKIEQGLCFGVKK